MIAFGSRLYGRIYRTRNGLYIATKFFHLFWLPVFPVESYVVTKTSLTEFTGIAIPLNRMSIVVAYIRGLLAVGTFTFIIGVDYLFEYSANERLTSDMLIARVWSGIGAICTLVLILSYWHPKISKASLADESWMEELVGATSEI